MPFTILKSLFTKRLVIAGTDLCFIRPNITHFEQWLELRTKSAEFLVPWEPKWPNDDLTEFGFKRRLKTYKQQWLSGRGHTFFLFSENGLRLIGGISLMRVNYGGSRSAVMGFWMGKAYANKGYMQLAIPALLEHGFDDLKLRKVEAACLPRNELSQHLLKKCGFTQVGYAESYLEINGKKEDHLLFAISRDDYIRALDK